MLQALLGEQQASFNQAGVGQVLPVLLEHPGRKPGQLVGRSPYMQAVHVPAPTGMLGEIAGVQIESAHPNSIAGTLVAKLGRSDANGAKSGGVCSEAVA